ncbi:MAG TPA: hypothetical protein VHV47_07140, partial [Opitutaceae bacterium]|nr:hypothetical protein [Opitutaceae bacterium]
HRFEQDPAFNNSRRYYGAVRFDPKLFDEHSHTSIRINYENGEVSSDNPRQLPPVDEITRWFTTGRDAYGNPGLNKLTINQFSLTNANPSGVPQPGATGSALSSATFELGGWAQTRSYWGDVLNYYEGTPTNFNGAAAAFPSGTPLKTIVAEPNTGLSLNGNGVIGALGFRPMGIPPESQYAAYVGPVSLNGFNYPGGAIPGGAYYADNVITDPTIFNFYKKLLDGPNKHEWQNWNSFNVALDQSFFDNRLAFEFVVDQQHYTQGANQWLTGSNYAISVDVNQTYANGTANPNVGRPYVGNATSNTNFQTTTDRHNLRFSPVWEIRPDDFISNPTLARMIGKQVFTGVAERNQVTTSNVTWAEFATTPQYILDNTLNVPGSPPNTGQLGSNREFDWIAYIGPNLSGASSAHNAQLNNTNFVIAPPTTQTATNFNSTWNAPSSVDPNAPFSWVSNSTGQTNTGTQKDNPANYVGWTQENINWMRASNPSDFPSLVTSANRTVYRDDSKGITYQGYLFGGSLVPALGLRSDHVTNYESNAQTDPISGFTSLNYPDNLASRSDVRGTSRSGGLVYHLPEGWFSHLPWEPTLSLTANDSENFKADASRLNLAGLPIPNATGKTKEGGFVLTALHDKITLKVNWFNTKVSNATLADTSGNSIGGLGNNAYFIADGTIWGYGWATALQDGIQGRTPGTNYWDYAGGDGLPNSTPAQQAAYNAYNLNGGSFNGHSSPGANAIVNAWLHLPVADQFFASYALTPTIIPSKALATGNLRDAWAVAPNDTNGPVTGAGSTFGNHQVTVDNLSRGTEIELTAEPLHGWDLTLNYSHVNATHENIDASAVAFIGAMTKFMNGPGGQVREWDNSGSTLGSQWNSSIVAPFTVELNELGHAAPEVSPWRLNLVSTYNFSQRPLRGAFLGGGLRVEAGRIIGYHFDPTFVNANSSDPNYAGVTALTLGGLNVNQPFIGSNESHVDAWAGYKWKLSHGIDWRIQLNLTNVGEVDHLEAARVQPDGSLALARIVEGMGWQLTNSFDF